ncbi:MAG TPA: deoxyguanosinetriphosphate triphosphohydrolase [Chthoniobacteraceae bacterium]|nr:deoxyguanosinetriphosphate triphosphohydrolase [Chthoniobacteraceae bacterium]
MRTRAEHEAAEGAVLAPYAQRSSMSRGRDHPEPPHPFRTEFERDRARIIHSRAFRRLEYKTQVFLSGTGDHLRTRLTHTIEVASISRTIARALGLNEDLTEAIALAHDLGHAPFGHSGEEMLDRLMRGHGGFEHNAQSLRIVEIIEQKYPRFPGLNLTWEVREGLRKHARFYDVHRGAPPQEYPCPTLEAQIANLADEITYYSHDLDDGLDFRLITPAQLAGLEVWQESHDEVRKHFPRLKGKQLQSYIIRCIIDRQVHDVITTSASAIARGHVSSVDEVRRQKKPLIQYGARQLVANRNLRKFLYANLYYHPRVADVNQRCCGMLRAVFAAYLAKPERLGVATGRRVGRDGLHRTVCDYLAGMTDRYLLDEYERLFGSDAARPSARVKRAALVDRESKPANARRRQAPREVPAAARRRAKKCAQ